MNDLQNIQSKIYEIRGRRVMLDSDLAALYCVETKNLKRAVKANIERFPPDFMFELTKEEYDSLRCKIFTSNSRGGNRYLPFAFTREGIAMLSGLLKSDIAVQANINIMRAFFQMQEALLFVSNTQLQLEQVRAEITQLRTDMNDTLRDQNDINEETRAQLSAISDALAELGEKHQSPLPAVGYAAIREQREKSSNYPPQLTNLNNPLTYRTTHTALLHATFCRVGRALVCLCLKVTQNFELPMHLS